MRPSRLRRATALLAALALALTACGGEDDGGATDGTETPGDATDGADGQADGADGQADAASQELGISVASFDLAVGEDRRLIAGVQTADLGLVGFGEVSFQIGYLGEDQAASEPVEVTTATATFLPVPGMEPEAEDPGQPTVLLGQEGTGVYEARVDLAEPGFYGLRVVAELEDGTSREGQAMFQVLPEALVPQVGSAAPATENLTIADVEAGEVDPRVVDSRAQGDNELDPRLHDTVIAEALEAGRPVVVAVSTPVYCVSRFCGPLVEEVTELAETYGDAADFVHLEVWENFDEQALNAAASEWIQTEIGGNEPWVFLVDGEGTIVGRWDNVLDVAELEEQLQAL
ncbi:hypothetical protein FTX61_12335 [Nitriliruptoraceae bacterium ZYF776]|nr:hypothetical protein [Profundirhabdus halotolerans]